MKRFFNILSVSILLLGLSGVANAYIITYDFTPVGNQYTSPYYATAEDFDGATLKWTWIGSGKVVSGNLINRYSAPGGVDGINKDLTKYMTAPDPDGGSTGSILAKLGNVYNYFGLWWGSIDAYNTLTFYNGGDVVLSFTGDQVTAAGTADGNQFSLGSNHYVNFIGLPDFDSFAMSSSDFAFEADNLTIGYNPSPVPEPTTMLLLGLGLIGLAEARRRFKKTPNTLNF